jgi:hypothetical protein
MTLCEGSFASISFGALLSPIPVAGATRKTA